MKDGQWWNKSWNPTSGCSPCASGCKHCWAKAMADRFNGGDFTLKLHPERLDRPLHWRKPCRIFVCSMSDLFHEKVPFEFIDKVYQSMIDAERHTYLLLTKRPKRMAEWVKHYADIFNTFYYRIQTFVRLGKNVHLGVSISNQAEADEKIPILLQIPAAVRFLSIEPMLGPIDLAGTDKSRMGKTGYLANYFVPFFCNHCGGHISKPPTCIISTCRYCGGHGEGHRKEKSIHGVIVGGESGPGARPMHPDWVRNIRDQCVAAGTPFYFKQWGEWLPDDFENGSIIASESLPRKKGDGWGRRLYTLSDGTKFVAQQDQWCNFIKVGKKKAGHLLDGKEWRELPE